VTLLVSTPSLTILRPSPMIQGDHAGRAEEGSGENNRANEIPRSRFSSSSLPPLFFLSFLVTFFYFAARKRNTSAAAGSVSGPARSGHRARRCAGEYLSERKTNSTFLSPSLSLSLTPRPSSSSLAERVARGGRRWKCGLFAEKSHSVGRAAAARITLFARGRDGVGGRGREWGNEETEGGGMGRTGEGSKKRRAHTRRSSPNIYGDLFAPSALDSARRKKSSHLVVLRNVHPPPFPSAA